MSVHEASINMKKKQCVGFEELFEVFFFIMNLKYGVRNRIYLISFYKILFMIFFIKMFKFF